MFTLFEQEENACSHYKFHAKAKQLFLFSIIIINKTTCEPQDLRDN